MKNGLTVWNISGFHWDAMKKKIETGFTLWTTSNGSP